MSGDKITHSIPEGALVEITQGRNAGARLWVKEQTFHEGAPVYRIGIKRIGYIEQCEPEFFKDADLRVIHVPDPILDEAINCNQTEAC